MSEKRIELLPRPAYPGKEKPKNSLEKIKDIKP